MERCFIYWMEFIIYLWHNPLVSHTEELDNQIMNRYGGEYSGL